MRAKYMALFLTLTLFCSGCAAGSTSEGSIQTPSNIPSCTPFIQAQTQPKVKHIFAIGSRSYAVLEDGSLWHWGGTYNTDAIFYPEKMEIPIGTKKIVGYIACFALLEDGTLWSWGYNYLDGWLGDGSTTKRNKPLKIMDDVKDIVMLETNFTDQEIDELKNNQELKQKYMYIRDRTFTLLAVKTDGTLWGWGRNTKGELGDGTYVSKLNPVKIMEQVDAVYANDRCAVIKKIDGSLWVRKPKANEWEAPPNKWEKAAEDVVMAAPVSEASFAYVNAKGELYQKVQRQSQEYTTDMLLENVVDVRQYENSTYVALQKDGTLWRWTVDFGEASLKKSVSSPEIFKKDIAKIIRNDENCLCVISEDNKAYRADMDKNLEVFAENFEQIAYGSGHYLMISAQDGKLYGWGFCNIGQLGVALNPDEITIALPVEILLPQDWDKMN